MTFRFICEPSIESCRVSHPPKRLRNAGSKGFKIYCLDDCYSPIIRYTSKRADYALIGQDKIIILEHKTVNHVYSPEMLDQVKGGLDIVRTHCSCSVKILLVVLAKTNHHISYTKQLIIRGCPVLITNAIGHVWANI